MSVDCTHTNKVIQNRLEGIYALHTKKMDFRLDVGPYIDLLSTLGNPHLNLPPTIHVAGTNGKGSTIAFMRSVFEEAGLNVHVYTSPHLIKFNERIVLNGHDISDEQLLTYLDMIDKANKGNSITFFEYTTVLAFKAFADHPADILLLETGLGGRLDCTNVIQSPIATAITSIGYDHTEWLGHDINAIAREKAGIIKPNAPCFIAPQQYDVMDVFKTTSGNMNAPFFPVKRHANMPELGLIGDHQQDNASLAIEVVKAVRPDISDDIIARGLKNTKWRARMEKLSDTPEIWFDCGHNADGAKTIATQLKQWKTEYPNRPIHLVVGLAADKDPNAFLSPLLPYIDKITCVDLPNARNPQTANDLKNKITIWNGDIETSQTPMNADMVDNSLTLICGSLYLYENAFLD